MNPPIFFFFFKIVLAIPDPLPFHISFIVILSIATKTFARILEGIVFNLQINLRIDNFTMLGL